MWSRRAGWRYLSSARPPWSFLLLGVLFLQPAGLVQEPVDDEVDRDGQQRDGAGRQQWRDVAVIDQGRVVMDHRAPIGQRRLDAQTEEGERADGQEDEAETQAELRHQRRHDVGQDLPRDDPAELLAL